MNRLVGFLPTVCLILLLSCPSYSHAFQCRWVYLSHNIAIDAEVQKASDVMRRAKTAGYNGVVLPDYKHSHHEKNILAIKKAAEHLGLDIIPMVGSIGQAGQNLLSHDPNLAEGMPVKNALFLVRGNHAVLINDPTATIRGGDFEQSQGNKFAGWDMPDKPGHVASADRHIRHGGFQSLRMDPAGKAEKRSASNRISQIVEVTPFRQYHLSAWIRTENFEASDRIRHAILTPSGQPISFTEWEVKKTQEWTKYHTVFNSQNNGRIRLFLSVSHGKEGKIWVDDVHMEEVGLLNVLRRNGCPLTVRSESGTTYREGKDFDIIRDERLGSIGKTATYHTPPMIRIPPGSRIRDGQKLHVSYYHAVTTNRGRQSACLSEPKVDGFLKQDMEEMFAVLKPKGFFLNYSEIRVANWCEGCRSRNLSPGQLLADLVSRSIRSVKEVNPKTEVFIWSDMFDPQHNAVDQYYLGNGSWSGSWKGLSGDVVVVNGNTTQRLPKSLKWFADLGHAQILAVPSESSPVMMKKWLEALRAVPKVVGVMYHTANGRYDDLEAFAMLAWKNQI